MAAGRAAARGARASGIGRQNLTMAVSHNHSSPYYSSTAWGAWAFQDVFDIRFYETMARRFADAVEQADAQTVPVRVSARTGTLDALHRNSMGPATADDGTPAGYPQSDSEHTFTVVRFDDVSARKPKPLAVLLNYSGHPEFLEGNNLLSADYLGPLERFVDRETGATTIFTQNAVGTAEPERLDVPRLPRAPGVLAPPVRPGRARRAAARRRGASGRGRRSASSSAGGEKLVPWMTERAGAGRATAGSPARSRTRTRPSRTAGPSRRSRARSASRSSACPTATATPTAERQSLPDTPYSPGVAAAVELQLPVLRRAAGDARHPPAGAAHRRHALHVLLVRAVEGPGAQHPDAHRPDARQRVARLRLVRAVHAARLARRAGGCARRSTTTRPAGTTPSTSCRPSPSRRTPSRSRATTRTTTRPRTRAYGYALTVPVSMANDYNGYIATYREYQRGDHYRKALTAYGPHSSDYLATRLASMGRALRGSDGREGRARRRAARAPSRSPTRRTPTRRRPRSARPRRPRCAAYEQTLPDDGGAPEVLAQPTDVERFAAAHVRWRGGDNYVDDPRVRGRAPRSGEGWVPRRRPVRRGRHDREVPGAGGGVSHLTGGQEWEWTATWEAFVGGRAPTRGSRAGHAGRAPTGSSSPARAATGGKTVPVRADVRRPSPSAVGRDHRRPARLERRAAGRSALGPGGDARRRDAARRASDDPPIPVRGPVGPIDYPDSYGGELKPRFIDDQRTVVRDPAAPDDASRWEWYCLDCAFRPWLDAGDAERVTVTVTGADGAQRRVAAERTAPGVVGAAARRCAAGESARSWSAGGVRDACGNFNGTRRTRRRRPCERPRRSGARSLRGRSATLAGRCCTSSPAACSPPSCSPPPSRSSRAPARAATR